MVEGLPVHAFKTREGDIAGKCPTETLIDDSRVNELTGLGFAALVHCKNTDHAAFFNTPSVQRPAKYDDARATASADLSSKLQYLMVTSRFAHYLKSICRDKIGSFMSKQDCHDFLNRWVSQYVLLMDNASQEAKAKCPLREASVEVIDDKARPGCYRAIIRLLPHFQLEQITVNLRLVSDLPKSAK
jgi:type VI secretion system protein ImpC